MTLIWITISFVTTDYSSLVNSALFIVFPSYIIDGLVVDTMRILSNLGGQNLEPNYLKTMMFMSLMGYVFISILKAKKTTLRSRFKRYFSSKIQEDDSINQTIIKFKEAMFMILKAIITNFRYIALLLSLLASLSTINLLNALLLFMTLQFAWNNKNDSKRWIYFVYYNTLFIPLLYFALLIPKGIQTFNIEVISILGVHSGN